MGGLRAARKFRRREHMKTVTIYTDGGTRFAVPQIDVPTRSPINRHPLGDDKAPSAERICT